MRSLSAVVDRVTGAEVVSESRLGSRATPRVSVGIPLYNYGHFLPDAVASVLAQEGVDVDVTIIDDVSTDDSLAVAERLAARDRRVTVVAKTVNRGHIETFSEALSVGSAPYLLKLDADDVLPAGALRRSVALLEARPDVAFCYGYAAPFHGEVPQLGPERVRSWSIWGGEDWLRRRARDGYNPILQPEVVIRRSALEGVGLHDPRVPAASDLHLWLRLSAVGSVGRVNGPVQGLYRVHGGNMHATTHGGEWVDLDARLAVFELFLDEHGHELRDPGAMRSLVRRTFADEALRLVVRDWEGDVVLDRPAADFLALAERLDPEIRTSRAWTVATRTTRGRPTWTEPIERAVRRRRRALGYALRWHVERRFGA